MWVFKTKATISGDHSSCIWPLPRINVWELEPIRASIYSAIGSMNTWWKISSFRPSMTSRLCASLTALITTSSTASSAWLLKAQSSSFGTSKGGGIYSFLGGGRLSKKALGSLNWYDFSCEFNIPISISYLLANNSRKISLSSGWLLNFELERKNSGSSLFLSFANILYIPQRNSSRGLGCVSENCSESSIGVGFGQRKLILKVFFNMDDVVMELVSQWSLLII